MIAKQFEKTGLSMLALSPFVWVRFTISQMRQEQSEFDRVSRKEPGYARRVVRIYMNIVVGIFEGH